RDGHVTGVQTCALPIYDLSDRLTAIVDIGGGSAEVILAAGGVVEQVVSLPLGAVRLSERYCKSDPLRRKHWKALRRGIDDTIDRSEERRVGKEGRARGS